MLKQYQHWIEAPVDAIVLGLYYLQIFYYNEIQRGLSGLGTYSLRPEFTTLLRPEDEAINLRGYSPEEIVQRVRDHNSICNEEEEEAFTISMEDAETKSTNTDHVTTKYSRAR